MTPELKSAWWAFVESVFVVLLYVAEGGLLLLAVLRFARSDYAHAAALYAAAAYCAINRTDRAHS